MSTTLGSVSPRPYQPALIDRGAWGRQLTEAEQLAWTHWGDPCRAHPHCRLILTVSSRHPVENPVHFDTEREVFTCAGPYCDARMFGHEHDDRHCRVAAAFVRLEARRLLDRARRKGGRQT